MRAFVILLAWLCALCGPASAIGHGELDIQARAGFRVDPQGKLDIAKAQGADFFRLPRPVLYPGYSADAYWFRILPPPGASLLEVETASLDYVDAYLPEAGGGYRHIAAGASQAFSPDGNSQRHPVFALPAGTPGPVYLRVASDSNMVLPLRLWHPAAYPGHASLEEVGNGLYLGMLLLLATYNLFLFFTLRDRRQLHYAGFIALLALHQAAGIGYAWRYLWPDDAWLARHAQALLLGLAVYVAARFVAEFLDLERKAPTQLWPLRLLRWSAIGLIAASILGPARLAGQLGDLLGLALILTSLALGVQRARQKSRPAYYFCAAWTALLLGLAVRETALAGQLPYVWVSEHAARLGILALAVLLSLALAERIALLRIRKLIAQSESNKHLKDLNAGLKTQVRARAAKLRSANKQLAEKNRILADIARHDGLTGLLNHASFMSLLRAQIEEAHRYGYPLALMMIDLDHFKRINDQYGHQLGDRVLAAVAKIVEGSGRISDTAGRYGGEEFAVLLPHTNLDAAVSLAERLRETVKALRIEGADGLTPSASFGVACIAEADRETTLDMLVQHADQALYRAKSEGRDQVRAWP